MFLELVSGFQGSTTLNTIKNKKTNSYLKWSHIAATYCALCSLVILGDDLSKVNRSAIINSEFKKIIILLCLNAKPNGNVFLGLRKLQLSNGCFKAAKDGTESDMRFLFCAASICYILDDWSGMDIELSVQFILESMVIYSNFKLYN